MATSLSSRLLLRKTVLHLTRSRLSVPARSTGPRSRVQVDCEPSEEVAHRRVSCDDQRSFAGDFDPFPAWIYRRSGSRCRRAGAGDLAQAMRGVGDWLSSRSVRPRRGGVEAEDGTHAQRDSDGATPRNSRWSSAPIGSSGVWWPNRRRTRRYAPRGSTHASTLGSSTRLAPKCPVPARSRGTETAPRVPVRGLHRPGAGYTGRRAVHAEGVELDLEGGGPNGTAVSWTESGPTFTVPRTMDSCLRRSEAQPLWSLCLRRSSWPHTVCAARLTQQTARAPRWQGAASVQSPIDAVL